MKTITIVLWIACVVLPLLFEWDYVSTHLIEFIIAELILSAIALVILKPKRG